MAENPIANAATSAGSIAARRALRRAGRAIFSAATGGIGRAALLIYDRLPAPLKKAVKSAGLAILAVNLFICVCICGFLFQVYTTLQKITSEPIQNLGTVLSAAGCYRFSTGEEQTKCAAGVLVEASTNVQIP